MDMNELILFENIEESQVPSRINEEFLYLKVLKDKIITATEKAEIAQFSAEKAKKEAVGVFRKKEAIESLQEATVHLAEAQIAAVEAQELSFEYQKKLGEITKYLFGLGVSNLAMNRSVVRELEMRLKGASEEELDELARQEILGVVRQLKAQEDIMKKQIELSERIKDHDKLINEFLCSNLELSNQITELQNKYVELENKHIDNNKIIENTLEIMKAKMDKKASMVSNIISLVIAAVAIIISIIQFLISYMNPLP
jgi:hypothetical protein